MTAAESRSARDFDVLIVGGGMVGADVVDAEFTEVKDKK